MTPYPALALPPSFSRRPAPCVPQAYGNTNLKSDTQFLQQQRELLMGVHKNLDAHGRGHEPATEFVR